MSEPNEQTSCPGSPIRFCSHIPHGAAQSNLSLKWGLIDHESLGPKAIPHCQS